MSKLLTITALAAALTLAGCGGGSGHHDDAPPAPPPTTTPPPTPPAGMVDAFFDAVRALIGDGSESTAEPVATDGIVATKPDDTEPVAVQ